MSSFIKLIQDSVLKPEMIQSAASALGENQENVSNALTALVPTLISKVTNTAATPEGSSSILELAKTVYSSGVLNNLSGFFGSDNSSLTTTIFNTLLGGESNKWFDSIANFAGIKSSSAQSLSGLVASSVLGSIGKEASENGLSASSLTSMLDGEKSFLSSILPAGITGLLGTLGLGSFFGNLTDGISGAADAVANTAGNVVDGAADAVKGATGAVVDATGSVVDGATDLAKGAANVVGDVAEGAVDAAEKVVDGAGDLAKGAANVVGDVAEGAVETAGKVVDGVGSAVKGAAGAVGDVAEDAVEAGSSILKWLLPLLLLAALVVGGVFLFKKCNGDVADAAKEGTEVVEEGVGDVKGAISGITSKLDEAGNIIYDLGKMVELNLRGGVKLNVTEKGTEKQLVNFIEAGEVDSVNKAAGWINLYDVQFQQGKDVYVSQKADSAINHMVAILKAYPEAKVKIGGYTSAEGKAADNIALSQKRADKVLADLKAKGVPADQLDKAEGYGSQFAKCDESKVDKADKKALEDCRSKDRYVAIKVVEFLKK